MKTFNKKLLAGALTTTLLLGTGLAVAQSRGGEQEPGQRLSYIFSELQLTEAQQADVIKVLDALREEHQQTMWDQMRALRDREDRPSREEMDALREAMHASQEQALTDQLNTVLSPELTAELVEYLSFHQPMMGGGRGFGHGGMHGDRGMGGYGDKGSQGGMGPGRSN